MFEFTFAEKLSEFPKCFFVSLQIFAVRRFLWFLLFLLLLILEREKVESEVFCYWIVSATDVV